MSPLARLRSRIRFDRNELAGAFGDIGTDLPLILGMLAASPGLDAGSVLVVFGAAQVLTGLVYGLPMPVQPLKLVAVLTITQGIDAQVIFGGGWAIAALMLALTLTRLIDLFERVVPKSVIRGIQLGLGIKLALLALGDYVPADGAPGFVLAAVGFGLTVWLWGNRRVPVALILIAMGIAYAFIFKVSLADLEGALGWHWPTARIPERAQVLEGLWLLALPQLPLSLGNSVLATRQVIADFYPDRTDSVRKIGLSYTLMNVFAAALGGIPTCHGSGGLVGQHAFGARTGGAVLIYGSLYLVLGLGFSRGFSHIAQLFPLPILGVILLFEAIALVLLVRDVSQERKPFAVAITTGLLAVALPYGFVVALIAGVAMAHLPTLRLGRA